MAEKRPVKLYKIGELMEFTGLSRQTIHNYTMLGLIKPARRTKTGHRLYGEETFELLERINSLKRDHTLSAIRELMHKESPQDEKPQDKDVKESENGRGADR
ncbi:MAG TPA: MerR family transcriptional regulator [Planctomycetota bacterium]|nr:MerR family transcriptional regulator [Planctomycetota bacterium]